MLNFPWTKTAQRKGAVLIASGVTDVPELLPTIATTTTTREGFCDSHSSVCEKLVHGYVLAHKFIHEHPDEAMQVAFKRMSKLNIADFKESMPLILKTTPKVPRYDEANFKHAQQLMVFGGMLKKSEARAQVRGNVHQQIRRHVREAEHVGGSGAWKRCAVRSRGPPLPMSRRGSGSRNICRSRPGFHSALALIRSR